jgi:hypothetical protein
MQHADANKEIFIIIKGSDSTRRHNSYKHICDQQQSLKLYEAITDKTEGKTGNSTIIPKDLYTLLCIIDKTIRQKINKEIEDVKSTINRPNRILHHEKTEFASFSSAHRAFSKIYHMLGHILGLIVF